MSSSDDRLKFKVVFLGNHNVGKTALITRFMYNQFDQANSTSTIGIDFASKSLSLGADLPEINLQLWDTAGQERFRSLIPSYIRSSDVAVIVYDITEENSFKRMTDWIDHVTELCSHKVLIYIVGNKVDLDHSESTRKRVIKAADGQKLAEERGLRFFETSAKLSQSVHNLFKDMAQQLYERHRELNEVVTVSKTVDLSSTRQETNSGGPCQCQ